MIPVYQTVTNHDPARGFYGDCARACVASIFELKLEDVPHFCEYDNGDGAQYLNNLRSWLRPRGMVPLFFSVPEDHYEQTCADLVTAEMDAYHLLGGRAGEMQHVVVAQQGRRVHDPYPHPYGELMPDANGTYEFGWFVYAGQRRLFTSRDMLYAQQRRL